MDEIPFTTERFFTSLGSSLDGDVLFLGFRDGMTSYHYDEETNNYCERYLVDVFAKKLISMIAVSDDLSVIACCYDEYEWAVYMFRDSTENYEILGEIVEEKYPILDFFISSDARSLMIKQDIRMKVV